MPGRRWWRSARCSSRPTSPIQAGLSGCRWFSRDPVSGLASKGVAGTLELREFPPGPAGLFPDPRGMRNRRGDPAFADGLRLAWQFAAGAGRSGRCVLWRLSLDGGVPDYAIDGGSLGAAFAVALRELLRRPRGSRSGLLAVPRAFFVGLRPRCAITGVLATQRPAAYDQLASRTAEGHGSNKVGDMDAKLEAARAKGLRTIAPAANRASAQPRATVPVDWAETIHQADRYARRVRPVRTAITAIAFLAVAGTSAGSVYAVQQRAGNQASQAVESSVQLAQEADNLRATDPAGAMWLSLTAYNSAHTSQARTALYNSYRTPYPLVLPGRGKGTVVTAVYSPDGRTAAVSWADGSVRLWNVRDPQHPRLAATVTPGPGSELAYSPDGKLLAVSTARSLELWTVANGLSLLSSTPVESADPRSGRKQWPIAFSPKGNMVATGSADGRVGLWNVSDPRHPASAGSLPPLGAAINAVAFSPDSATLAVAGGSRVRLWDVRDPGRPTPRAVLAAESALSVAFSPDGRLLAAGGAQEQVSLWNVAHPSRAVAKTAGFIPYPHGDIDSVAFRPGDNVFVATDTAGETSIWTYNGSPDHTSAEQNGLPDAAHPDSVAFSPNGRQLVTGDLGGTADIWIVPAPLLPATLDTRFGSRSQVNQDGTLMLTEALTNDVTSSRPAELWDVADPAHPSLAAVLPSGWVNGGFLSGGRTLFTENSSPDMIQFWNVADPRHPRAEGAIPEAPFGSWSSGYDWLLVWTRPTPRSSSGISAISAGLLWTQHSALPGNWSQTKTSCPWRSSLRILPELGMATSCICGICRTRVTRYGKRRYRLVPTPVGPTGPPTPCSCWGVLGPRPCGASAALVPRSSGGMPSISTR